MRTVIVVALIALGVPGGTSLRAQATASMPASHAGMPMQQGGAFTALLTSPLGSRGASGNATVSGTAVRVIWSGDQPDAVRVWSVRRGSCARDEGLVGAPGAYPAMTVDASGSASGNAILGASLAGDGEFHVLVQSSAGPPTADATATIIACGVLGNAAAPTSAVGRELTTSPNGSKPAAVDHLTMDHSTMDHSATNVSSTGASSPAAGASSPSMNMSGMGDTDTSLMAIHMRMMADPVILERVMSDPVLQRMMAQMPGMSSMDMDMAGMTSAPAGSGAAATAKTARTMAKPVAKPATRAAAKPAKKPATKPAAKPAAKPAPAAMPGMDHSKMPGMDHSKMPVSRKPPA